MDTSYLRTDGKEEFREKREFGNRHAVFDKNSSLGIIHQDKFNATDFPIGTINHFSNYVEEKTGIPKILTTIVTVGIVLYASYKLTR